MLNPHYDPELGRRTSEQYDRIKKLYTDCGSTSYNCDADVLSIFKAVKKLAKRVSIFDTVVQEHINGTTPNDPLSQVKLLKQQADKINEDVCEFHVTFLMAIADYLEMNKAKYEKQKTAIPERPTLRRQRAEAQG